MANAAAAVWRLGDGGQQHRGRPGRPGWDVTLFATARLCHPAHLHAVVSRGYEEDRSIDPKVAEYLHIAEAFEHAAEFDLIHSHYDFMALAYTRLVKTPVLTTIHGFSSPQIMPVYEKYRDGYFVSISDSDRSPGSITWQRFITESTSLFTPTRARRGEDLIFIGRMHPDKGVHLAIEVATSERAAVVDRRHRSG